MAKPPIRTGSQLCSSFPFIVSIFCFCLFRIPALAQQIQNSLTKIPYTTTISPKFSKVNSLTDEGLDEKSLLSMSDGRIVYSPTNVEGGGLLLYIDEKKGDSIRRTSYDFTSFLENQRGTRDTNKAPFRLVSPQISSDGSQVIFENAIYEDHYQLFCLNLKTNVVDKVTGKLVSYRYTSISPDGQHVAFVEGGNSFGEVYETQLDDEYYIGPLKLFVADAEGTNKHLVAQGDFINGELQWNSQGELFYGIESNPENQKDSKLKNPKLDIYSFDVKLKKTTLLVENGVMPYPFADGKGVVFFGPSDQKLPMDWGQNWRRRPPSRASICYATFGGEKRIAFEPVGKEYPAISWLPNGTQFVSLRETASGADVMGELRSWDIETQNTKIIAKIEAKNASKFPTAYSQFGILDVNSSKITLSMWEFVGVTNNKGTVPHFRNSVVSVKLANGVVTIELSSVEALSHGYDVRFD